jgi:hypothetical protein
MVLFGDALITGIVMSNFALWLAMLLQYRFVLERWDEAVAERTVWYCLIFPTAFFGSAVYTESLFILVTVGCFIFYRQERWWAAALCAAAAALCRSVGVILLPVLLLAWWQNGLKRRADRPKIALAPAAAVPIALSSFMFFLNQNFGDPFAFSTAQVAWQREPQSPLTAISYLFDAPINGWVGGYGSHLNNWIDFLFAALFIGLGIVLWRWGYSAEAAFVLLGVLMPISTGQLVSLRRYVWVLFPAFIVLAQWGENKLIDRTITTLSLVGLALFSAMFALGYFVA